MSVEVSSPKVEDVLKGKEVVLFQSRLYPRKYAGKVFGVQEDNQDSSERCFPDFMFVIDLNIESNQPQFYDVSNPNFSNLMKDLQINPNQEWVEIEKCETFTIHSVLLRLVEHIEEMTKKKGL